MKTSESSLSQYLGSPFSVFRVIEGTDRLHPNPKGPFPDPESYCNESLGEKSERLGVVKIGMVKETLPLAALTENFSPMPLIAPPPLGRERIGAEKELPSKGVFLPPDFVAG